MSFFRHPSVEEQELLTQKLEQHNDQVCTSHDVHSSEITLVKQQRTGMKYSIYYKTKLSQEFKGLNERDVEAVLGVSVMTVELASSVKTSQNLGGLEERNSVVKRESV